jgi:DNA-binding cell septation regulator SpoVG
VEIVQVWITGRPKGSYLASVAMELKAGEHRLHIRGMRLIAQGGRRFLAMPSRKTSKGWQDLLHPLEAKTRQMLEDAAIKQFETACVNLPAADDEDYLEQL